MNKMDNMDLNGVEVEYFIKQILKIQGSSSEKIVEVCREAELDALNLVDNIFCKVDLNTGNRFSLDFNSIKDILRSDFRIDNNLIASSIANKIIDFVVNVRFYIYYTMVIYIIEICLYIYRNI